MLIVFILVGTHCDEYEDEQVSQKEAKEYADSIGIDLFIVSSKNRNHIDNLLDYIEYLIINPKSVKFHNKNNFGLFKIINKKNAQKKKNQCI